MGRRSDVSGEKRDLIVSLSKDGTSSRQIASLVGVSDSTVRKIVARHRTTGSAAVKPRSGRPRKTCERQDRHLKVLSLANRFKTATKLRAELESDSGVRLSRRTVRRRLQSVGLRGCVAVKKPFISPANKKKRLKFAREHKDWSAADWATVLWSDESKFNMRGSDGAQYVRRREGEALSDRCTRKTVKHGGGHIMVWGCMCSSGTGRVFKVEGNMKHDQYIGILQNVMRPSMADLFPDGEGVFQHDNDPKHTAKATKQWLASQDFETLKWPAQSPDLNPIENLWRIVGVKRQNVTMQPQNEAQLWQVCKRAWRLITPDICRDLVDSMPKRMAAVIAAKGGATKW